MILRGLTAADWEEQAELIHGSLSTWYRTRLNSAKFGDDPVPFRVFPELYEALDPGCCLVAQDEEGGPLTGTTFFHPRETHWAVGIVATHPGAAGRGVARRLMEEIIGRAEAEGKPVRLVSSAMNLDSFSLYTRLGFVPRRVFQDMKMEVPDGGMPAMESGRVRVRVARDGDVGGLADLEMRLNGIRREKDLRHFVENRQGCWRLWVAEDGDGVVSGFLGAVVLAGSKMVGPGVCADEEVAAVLLRQVLDAEFRGQAPVWLVPVDCAGLVKRCYEWGARNVELHLASVRGEAPEMRGVTLPTFMPETG
jgi:GNAT superfamily N-acetyltransferase